ncbi:hypothetical protein ACSW8S_16870 (plasmid) [Clostridium perfringens]
MEFNYMNLSAWELTKLYIEYGEQQITLSNQLGKTNDKRKRERLSKELDVIFYKMISVKEVLKKR